MKNNKNKLTLDNVNKNVLTKRYAWTIKMTLNFSSNEEKKKLHEQIKKSVPWDYLLILITNANKINNQETIYTTYLEVYSEKEPDFVFIDFKKKFKIEQIVNPEQKRNEIIHELIENDIELLQKPVLVIDPIMKQMVSVERYIRKMCLNFKEGETNEISSEGLWALNFGLIGYYPTELLNHSNKINQKLKSDLEKMKKDELI